MTSLRQKYVLTMAATGVPVLLFAAFVAVSARAAPVAAVLGLWGSYFATIFAVWAVVGVVAIVSVLARPLVTRDFTRSPRDLAVSILTSRWREDFGLSVIWPPLLMAVLFSSFVVFKQLILRNAGFGADAVLDHLDRILFFGFRPWQLTHALPAPWTTLFLDKLYASWFLPMAAAFLVCAFVGDRGHLRTRYVLAFVWTWLIGGGVLAYLLGSAGPCFGGQLPGDTVNYSDLMGVLHADQAAIAQYQPGARLFALSAQGYLENLYLHRTLGFGGGISAAPSMHVALATLIALAGRRIGRVVGWVALAYVVLIGIACVHLGWHYAVDCLIAAATTLLIWSACGAVVKRIFGDEATTPSGVLVSVSNSTQSG